MRKLILFLLLPLWSCAQGYQTYFTGSSENSTAVPTDAKCFMGGGTMPPGAVNWILSKANGGDVVVLSTASNNYGYLYNTGVTVNSVETIILNSSEAGTSTYILDKIAGAELIILGEGNQWDFITYLRNTPIEDAINNHINVKHAPVAGIGAGMSILGSVYYTAEFGQISSADALNNPLDPNMTLSFADFLQPYGQGMIYTESNFNIPDRRGRAVAALARMFNYPLGFRIHAYACNENTAMCIQPDGNIKVYGTDPATDFAYLITHNCHNTMYPPITLQSGPLSWPNYGGLEPLYVVKVPGNAAGTNSFKLPYGEDNSGAIFEYWDAQNGVLEITSAPSSLCSGIILGNPDDEIKKITMAPNPFDDFIEIYNANGAVISIYDISGKKLLQGNEERINTSGFASGLYIVHIAHEGNVAVKKMMKR